jgi:predicted NBD/HSP70 family sugar kinase
MRPDAGACWNSVLPKPAITPSLDPLFRPAPIAWRNYQARARQSGHPLRVRFAIEQRDGAVSRFAADLLPDSDALAASNFRMLERFIKLTVWTRGGNLIHLEAPAAMVAELQRYFQEDPCGRFDSRIVGESVYGHPIEVVHATELPAERFSSASLGGHLEGCRIGFDLGGSDRKVAAVIDGRVVFSEETAWDPYHQTDPQYHWDGIMDSLRHAAQHLPRVDAIGGSAAGVYLNNTVRFSSLFRGIEGDLFEKRVRNIFLDIKHAWHDVPFEVTNDGVVTALCASMSYGTGSGVLGIALGTSTAGGYVARGSQITPWLDEIAFAPIDYRSDAPIDEWSGDNGCLVQYLSQQAVGRLLGPANVQVPASMSLPKRLEHLQALMRVSDPRAPDVYQTIGTYLGYTIAHLSNAYTFDRVLVLGRVTSGPGGSILVDTARDVLRTEFPDLAGIVLSMPDEKDRRLGQAVAAASLPA